MSLLRLGRGRFLLSRNEELDMLPRSIPHPRGLRLSFLHSAVNGYMYGNQPGLQMCRGNSVAWHLIGMGTDTDMHGVYFQGNTIHLRGTHRDSFTLFPHVATTAFMQPDHAGKCRATS